MRSLATCLAVVASLGASYRCLKVDAYSKLISGTLCLVFPSGDVTLAKVLWLVLGMGLATVHLGGVLGSCRHKRTSSGHRLYLVDKCSLRSRIPILISGNNLNQIEVDTPRFQGQVAIAATRGSFGLQVQGRFTRNVPANSKVFLALEFPAETKDLKWTARVAFATVNQLSRWGRVHLSQGEHKKDAVGLPILQFRCRRVGTRTLESLVDEMTSYNRRATQSGKFTLWKRALPTEVEIPGACSVQVASGWVDNASSSGRRKVGYLLEVVDMTKQIRRTVMRSATTVKNALLLLRLEHQIDRKETERETGIAEIEEPDTDESVDFQNLSVESREYRYEQIEHETSAVAHFLDQIASKPAQGLPAFGYECREEAGIYRLHGAGDGTTPLLRQEWFIVSADNLHFFRSYSVSPSLSVPVTNVLNVRSIDKVGLLKATNLSMHTTNKARYRDACDVALPVPVTLEASSIKRNLSQNALMDLAIGGGDASMGCAELSWVWHGRLCCRVAAPMLLLRRPHFRFQRDWQSITLISAPLWCFRSTAHLQHPNNRIMRVYDGGQKLNEQLNATCTTFLSREVRLNEVNRVIYLPRICEWYRVGHSNEGGEDQDDSRRMGTPTQRRRHRSSSGVAALPTSRGFYCLQRLLGYMEVEQRHRAMHLLLGAGEECRFVFDEFWTKPSRLTAVSLLSSAGNAALSVFTGSASSSTTTAASFQEGKPNDATRTGGNGFVVGQRSLF
ncbi:hypothetical protein GQ600_15926 [Phytophthora cactorum]|nr:hypothetical protein GQ600_15926 [Phytophthora cactorum]